MGSVGFCMNAIGATPPWARPRLLLPRSIVRPWMIGAILLSFAPGEIAVSIAGKAPDITVADVLVLVFGLVALVFLDLRVEEKFVLLALTYLEAMVLSILVTAITDARDPIHALASVRFFIFGFAAFALTVSSLSTQRDADQIINALIGFGVLFSLLLLNSFEHAVTGTGETARDVKDGTFLMGHLGAYWMAVIMPCVPLAVARTFTAKRKWLILPSLIIFLLALLLSMSKGAIVALVVASAFVLRRQWKELFTWRAFYLLMGIAVFCWLLPQQIWLYPSSIFSEFVDRGDVKRLDLWAMAWDLFKRHPLLGVGPGGSKYFVNTLDESNPHNFILGSLAEVGLLGTVPFLALIAMIARRAFALKPSAIHKALQISILATLLHGCVEPTFIGGQEYSTVFWIIAGVCVFALRSQPALQSVRPRPMQLPGGASPL